MMSVSEDGLRCPDSEDAHCKIISAVGILQKRGNKIPVALKPASFCSHFVGSVIIKASF